MVCKFCGTGLRPATLGSSSQNLVGKLGGQKCWQSPHGKHEASSSSGETMICKYCGKSLRCGTIGNMIPVFLAQRGGQVCNASPTKKHELPG